MSVARWAALAVVFCALLAVAYLPPEPEPDPFIARGAASSSEQRRLNVIDAAQRRTEELLSTVMFRDSLQAAVRTHETASGDVTFVARGTIATERAQTIRSAVERVWEQVHRPGGSRLLVLLYVSTHFRQRYSTTYALPEALDGHTCAVSIGIDPTLAWVRNNSVLGASDLESVLQESLAPCLYYAAFGPPGPHIHAWLLERSFKLANSADWTGKVRTGPDWAREAELRSVAISNMSFDAIACTSGRRSRCGAAVAHVNDAETFRARQSAPAIPGVFQRAYWQRNFMSDDYYLASLVREMGHDRFAQFWRSPAPLDSAFVSAFGQPIDVWTAHWARSYLPGVQPFGPAPRASSVLSSLALAAIAATLAAAAVTRRQVG